MWGEFGDELSMEHSPGVHIPECCRLLTASTLRGSSCRAGETKAVIALCVKSVKSYIQPRSSFGNFPAKRLGLFGKHALLKAAPARDPPLQWGKRLALDAAGARKAFFGGGNTKMLFVCGEGLCSPEVPTDLE